MYEISLWIIIEIAKETNLTVGKWMIFRRRSMIDETWKAIAEATVAGKLGCSSKVDLLYCRVKLINAHVC